RRAMGLATPALATTLPKVRRAAAALGTPVLATTLGLVAGPLTQSDRFGLRSGTTQRSIRMDATRDTGEHNRSCSAGEPHGAQLARRLGGHAGLAMIGTAK